MGGPVYSREFVFGFMAYQLTKLSIAHPDATTLPHMPGTWGDLFKILNFIGADILPLPPLYSISIFLFFFVFVYFYHPKVLKCDFILFVSVTKNQRKQQRT